MKWIVVINDEGIQAKVPVGDNLKDAERDQNNLKKYGYIKFIFESDPPGQNPERNREYREWFAEETEKLHKKYGAASPREIGGYNMRKQTAMGNGVEILADLDAKDYDEFGKKYSGYNGATEILLNTERILSGRYNRDNPGKSISNLIKKLEISADE